MVSGGFRMSRRFLVFFWSSGSLVGFFYWFIVGKIIMLIFFLVVGVLLSRFLLEKVVFIVMF